MRVYTIICTLLLLFSLTEVRAQYVAEDSSASRYVSGKSVATSQPSDTRTPFVERLRFGGNFGLSFGNTTYIEASPLVVYAFNDKFQAGPGLTYIYYRSNVAGYSFSTSQYGGRLFGRYTVYENFFLQAEMESLNIEAHNDKYDGRYWIVNPLVGGGYFVPFGDHGGVYATGLYNLNYNSNLSPYPSPLIVRLGFTL